MTKLKLFITFLLSTLYTNTLFAQNNSYSNMNNNIVNTVNSKVPLTKNVNNTPLKSFNMNLDALFNRQSPSSNNKLSLKDTIIGCYSEDGDKLSVQSICLFADGSFYYPTLLNITGKYTLKDNKVHFFPTINNTFDVYARHNPTLSQATTFNFSGFTSDSLINFNDQGFNYIPVEKSSCHWQSKVEVYHYPKKVNSFSLAYVPNDKQASQTMMTYSYQQNTNLNDFLLVHNRPTISKTPAVVINDGELTSKVWLQMGRNTMSMSRIAMKNDELIALQNVGHRVARTGNNFPKMIDQNDNLTMQNTKKYFLDRKSNVLFPNAKKIDVISKGWRAYIKPQMQKGNTPYLKVYNKLKPVAQGMQQVAIENRLEALSNDCL